MERLGVSTTHDGKCIASCKGRHNDRWSYRGSLREVKTLPACSRLSARGVRAQTPNPQPPPLPNLPTRIRYYERALPLYAPKDEGTLHSGELLLLGSLRCEYFAVGYNGWV